MPTLAIDDRRLRYGTFGRMPEPLAAYLIKETASNVKDVEK